MTQSAGQSTGWAERTAVDGSLSVRKNRFGPTGPIEVSTRSDVVLHTGPDDTIWGHLLADDPYED